MTTNPTYVYMVQSCDAEGDEAVEGIWWSQEAAQSFALACAADLIKQHYSQGDPKITIDAYVPHYNEHGYVVTLVTKNGDPMRDCWSVYRMELQGIGPLTALTIQTRK